MKRKRENKEEKREKKKRKKTNLIRSIANIKYQSRLNDVFKNIFEFYNHNDIDFVNEENIYYKLEIIIIEFCDLLLQSKGEFQISDDSIFLFEDKRFFIPKYFLLPSELKIIIKIINKKLILDPKYQNTKLFETVPHKFEIDFEIRTNLLYSYFRHLAQTINDYFLKFSLNKEEEFQYKIILAKKMIDICNHIGSVYNFDLENNKNIFKDIIKQAKINYLN